ncbi:MAG: hypothetical protein HOH43_15735 [Candidatus Latescibacteria bacterium]|nr:hypothetical protein [Candidatus Latescibacterota bacterium]
MASTSTDRTRIMVEIAVVASLATVLGFFRLYRLPWGGSVSLKLLPLLYLAFRRGPKAGAAGGLISGLITLVLDPVILHPVQVLLDYILPNAAVGMAGWFLKSPRIGICLSLTVGFVLHVCSGAVFFAAYAPIGLNSQVFDLLQNYLGITVPYLLSGSVTPWLYAVLYNGSLFVPELILMLILVPYLINRIKGGLVSERAFST